MKIEARKEMGNRMMTPSLKERMLRKELMAISMRMMRMMRMVLLLMQRGFDVIVASMLVSAQQRERGGCQDEMPKGRCLGHGEGSYRQHTFACEGS